MRAFSKFSTAIFIVGLTLLLMTSASRGGSIFDDDYTPPKRAEPETPAPAPTPAPENPAVPTPTNPAPSVSKPDVPAPAATHHGLPDKPSRTKCKKLFEEVYATELKDHSAAARKKLAKTLLDEAAKNPEGSADRYMLLIGAVQAGEEGQSLGTCFTAAKLLTSQYDMDELATKTDAATKTFAGAPSAALSSLSNIEGLFSLSDQLVAEEAFATDAQVESAIQKAVPKIADPDLQTEAKNQIKEVAAMREARQKIAPTLVKLKQSPDDPAANLAVGSYYCFQQANWEKGLPLLAKSNDARLKELATTELAGATDADAKVKLADNWVAAAAKLAVPDRPKAMQHAAGLYRIAEGGLTDLQRLAVEKRLGQIPPPSHMRRVDLLELFDPATSPVSGAWRTHDDVLACEPAEAGRVQFAYEPPDEYDFKIGFTASALDNGITQICSAGGHPFMFFIGAHSNSVAGNFAGFQAVNGADGFHSGTAKRKDHWLTLGQHYTSVVRVRNGYIEGYLDGKLVSHLKTDYSNLSLDGYWKLPGGNVIGFGLDHGCPPVRLRRDHRNPRRRQNIVRQMNRGEAAIFGWTPWTFEGLSTPRQVQRQESLAKRTSEPKLARMRERYLLNDGHVLREICRAWQESNAGDSATRH